MAKKAMENSISKIKKIKTILVLALILILFNFSQVKATFFPSLDIENIENEELKNLLGEKLTKRSYLEGEILIKFKKDKIDLNTEKGKLMAEDFINSKFLRTKKIFSEYNFILLTIEDKKKVKEKIEELKNDSSIEFVQPNYIYYLQTTFPNDPEFNKLWGLHNTGQAVNNFTGTLDSDIDAPEAWDIATSSNVIIAVIDTGVDYNHPDLINNIWKNEAECTGTPSLDDDGNGYIDDCYGWDFYNYDNDPMDDNGHGTHCAGIIAAEGNNATGTVGVSWRTKIMPLKFLSAEGRGYTWDAVSAIDYAINNGAKILSNSWGSYYYDPALFEAIKRAKEKGVLVVAAAGNERNDNDGRWSLYPASYNLSNIISVAASTQNDSLTWWSNYGRNSVDVAAPGDNILSTVPQFSGAVFASTTNYKVIYFSFGFEGINDNTGYTNRATVMGRALQWLGAATSSPILLVDADQCKETYFPNSNVRCDLRSIYIDALTGAGYSNIEVWDLQEKNGNPPSADQMAGKYVIWFTGFEPLFTSHSTELAKFLDNGGRLLLSGQDIGFWISLGLGDPYFYENYLHAKYLGDINLGGQFYKGLGIFDGITIDLRYGIGGDGANNQFWIDIIEPISPGASGFQNERYAYLDGTSMATPFVSGLAALIWQKNPNLDYLQVKNLILASGDDEKYPISTKKRINAYNALTFDTTTLNPVGDFSTIKGAIWQKEKEGNGLACGEININFRVKDTQPGLSIRLEDFQYSVDGGLNWKAVPATSSALALNWWGGGDWRDNDYVAATDWTGKIFNFWFLTLEPDVKADFENQDQDDVKIRFKVSDGFKTSDYLTSENFRVDNLAPQKPTITSPTTTPIIIDAYEYKITGTTTEIIGDLADTYIEVYVYRNDIVVAKKYFSTAATTTFEINVPLLQDTSNQFKVTVVDRFGNESEPATFEIIEDSRPPLTYLMNIEGKEKPPYFVNSKTPKVEIYIDEPAKCRWSATNTNYSLMPPENECEVTTSTATCNLANIGGDGKKLFFVSCIDQLDHSQLESTKIEFTLDTIKPEIFSVGVSPASVSLGEEVEIKIAFVDTGVGVDTASKPLVKITGLNKEYLVEKLSGEIAESAGAVFWLWKGKFTVPKDERRDVTAYISVSQVKDLAGNMMEPNEKAGSFYIKFPTQPVTGDGGGAGFTFFPPPKPKEKIGKTIVTPQKGEKVTAISPEKITVMVDIPTEAVEKETEIKIIPITRKKAKVGPLPAGTSLVGNYVFDFSAIAKGKTIIFLKPVKIIFTYTDKHIKDFKEKTLTIYRWEADISQWKALPSEVDITTNTVTATTTQFSYFALMGEKEKITKETPEAQTIQTLKKLIQLYTKLIDQKRAQFAQIKKESLVEKPKIEEIPAGFKFTKPLKIGDRNIEVRYLQMFLKAEGPKIYPQQLVTGYFDLATLRAVCRFQIKEGLVGRPIDPRICGYVGPATRAKINEMLYNK